MSLRYHCVNFSKNPFQSRTLKDWLRSMCVGQRPTLFSEAGSLIGLVFTHEARLASYQVPGICCLYFLSAESQKQETILCSWGMRVKLRSVGLPHTPPPNTLLSYRQDPHQPSPPIRDRVFSVYLWLVSVLLALLPKYWD